MDGAIKPLAKVLAREKNLHLYLMGPFGLRCACIIVLYSDKNKRPLEQVHWTLTVMPNFNGNNLELWYDTFRVVREYPPGSIGELNSVGNEILPLPGTTEEIIALMKHSEGIQEERS